MSPTTSRIHIDDHALEVVEHNANSSRAKRGRALVLLHEGLGSVSAWREWPAQLAERTSLRTIAYSRRGYGASDACALPRPLTYMHDEARGDLPKLLDALAVDDCILVGHSDGASIAILHAGTAPALVKGVALLAPHVFVEDVSIRSIEEAKNAYATTNLRERLAKHHANVDVAFRGWNDAWLDPGFRSWNIESSLAGIRVPTLVVQGENDPYGTLAQVDAIRRQVSARVDVVILPECGHAPHREKNAETTEAVARFVASIASSA